MADRGVVAQGRELRRRVVGGDDPHRDAAGDDPPQQADPSHVREPQRQQPAGGRGKGREPCAGARVERGERQHDALRHGRGARGQHDHARALQRPPGPHAVVAVEDQHRVEEGEGCRPLRRRPRNRERRGDGAGPHDAEDRRGGVDRGRSIHDDDAAARHAPVAESRRDRLRSPVELRPRHRAAHATASTASSRYRPTASSSTSMPRPPGATASGSHIRPSSTTSSSRRRSCSSRPAVARP